jgi:hypothetical protein
MTNRNVSSTLILLSSSESSYNKYGRAVFRSNQQKAHIPVVVAGARTVDE